MTRYIAHRLLLLAPLVLGITLIAYLLINLAPGDPVSMLVNPSEGISVSDLEARKEALGLNAPVLVRYVRWLGEMLRGNFGYSYSTGRPVGSEIFTRLGATLQLMAISIFLSLLFGIPAGVVSAVRQYSWLDHALNLLTFFLISLPSFFLGLGLIYLLSLKAGLLPTGGMGTLGAAFSLADRLKHLILPGLVLSLTQAAELLRYTRSSLLEVLNQDYVRTARSKGLSNFRVVVRHALRNAMLPVITIVGLTIPQLLSGALITETIFQWPGLGTLSINAISQRDYPVVLGVTLMSAIAVLTVNLITDLTYAMADPRIRYDS